MKLDTAFRKNISPFGYRIFQTNEIVYLTDTSERMKSRAHSIATVMQLKLH